MSDRTMRALMIAGRVPYPVDDGWKMRTFNILKELAHLGVEVDFIAFGEGSPDDPCHHEIRGLCNRLEIVPRRKSYAMSDLLRGLVLSTPFSVLNYYDAEFVQRVDSLATSRHYDLLQVEDIVMAPYARNVSAPVKFLDMHNVESHLMERYAAHEPGVLKRVYAGVTASKLAAYERDVSPWFDCIFVCSDNDRDQLQSMGITTRVEVVANGIDPSRFSEYQASEEQDGSIVFVGSMDYHANITGITYFVKNILPLIHVRLPAARLVIVGKNPPEEVLSLACETVEVTGSVPDVRPYLAKASVVVVPLLVGGGTRLKILEAMAMGKAVVSTSLGCEGLTVEHGSTIYVEDEPQSFADRVVQLISDPGLAGSIAREARQFVLTHYDWNCQVRKMHRIAEDSPTVHDPVMT